jgi:preprotein translocase subunit SecA
VQYMPHLVTRNMTFKDIEFEGSTSGETINIGWLGESGSVPIPEQQVSQAIKKKIGRNERCPCKSGKKYKRCHGQFGGSLAPSV